VPLEVEPYWFTSLRRGAVGFGNFLRPAIRPLAIGGALLAGGFATKSAIDAYGRAANPPAQTIPVDTDPAHPGIESFGIFDPRSGRLTVLGAPPSDTGTADRSNERNLLVLAGAVVGLVAVLAFARGGK
jgi:hypothetical protein